MEYGPKGRQKSEWNERCLQSPYPIALSTRRFHAPFR